MGADMWSVGVIVYTLLGGTMPFQARNLKSLFKTIIKGDVHFDDQYWHHVSREAKALVLLLLQVEPDNRLTAKDALRHPWFSQLDACKLASNELQESKRMLGSFNARMKLKSAMFAVMAVTNLGFTDISQVVEDEDENVDEAQDQ